MKTKNIQENSVSEVKRIRVVNVLNKSYDVYIGRAHSGLGEERSFLANPFTVNMYGRSLCLQLYKTWFDYKIENNPEFKDKVLSLQGKTLGCWCRPEKCHGDIIVGWLSVHGIGDSNE